MSTLSLKLWPISVSLMPVCDTAIWDQNTTASLLSPSQLTFLMANKQEVICFQWELAKRSDTWWYLVWMHPKTSGTKRYSATEMKHAILQHIKGHWCRLPTICRYVILAWRLHVYTLYVCLTAWNESWQYMQFHALKRKTNQMLPVWIWCWWNHSNVQNPHSLFHSRRTSF